MSQSDWWDGAFPITQVYGYTAFEHPHTGVDYGLPADTPLKAAVACTLLSIGAEPHNYGSQYPTIRLDGDAYDLILGHADRTVVPVGARLSPGQVFAYSGGDDYDDGVTTGAHVHVEARLRGTGYGYANTVEPTPYLHPTGSVLPSPKSKGGNMFALRSDGKSIDGFCVGKADGVLYTWTQDQDGTKTEAEHSINGDKQIKHVIGASWTKGDFGETLVVGVIGTDDYTYTTRFYQGSWSPFKPLGFDASF